MINNPIHATAFFHESGKRQNKAATARLRMKREAVGCAAAFIWGWKKIWKEKGEQKRFKLPRRKARDRT